jgi:hypothetical protein
MAQDALVKEEIDEGLTFLRTIDPILGVRAAYWLKVPHREYWRLHIATDKVKSENKYEYFPALTQAYLKGDYDNLDALDITLDLDNDPIAKGVIEYKTKNITDKGKRLSSQLIGGEYVEGAYIYAYPPSSN